MGDARDDLLDIHDIQHALLLLRLADLVQRADFINHVNRLIRQKTLGDMPKRQLRRAFEGLIRVMNFVIFLETWAQAMQDFHRVLNRRLGDVNFLKTPRKGAIMLEMAAVILMRRRADAAQIVGVQRVFQQAGSVHRRAGRRARADNRVDFIHEQRRAKPVFDLFVALMQKVQDRFQALLELAAKLRSGQ